MILIFFDYIYYRTYSAYKDWNNIPYMYAVGLIALMQQFNVATILFIVFAVFDLNTDVNKYVLYASFFIFLIPNYIRYTKFKNYEELKKKWGNDKKSKKVLGSTAVILYVILSTVIFLTGAIILGKIKRGEL